MTELYDLIKDSASAVARDADVAKWCRVYYGVGPEIMIDEDVRDPDDNAPAVRFHSPWKRAAEDRRAVEAGFYLYVIVNTSADALNPDVNLAEFAATEELSALLGLVLTCIRSNKPAAAVMEYDLQTDTITNYPYFEAEIALQFTENVTIGSDPLEDF